VAHDMTQDKNQYMFQAPLCRLSVKFHEYRKIICGFYCVAFNGNKQSNHFDQQ